MLRVRKLNLKCFKTSSTTSGAQISMIENYKFHDLYVVTEQECHLIGMVDGWKYDFWKSS